jgi:uncharacterized protein YdaU (DUF1376 family)
MNYYQFHIGDYKSHTHHLSPIEDIIYRRLLDVYYLQEQPLNAGSTSVARQINMREYEKDVELVLNEFFTLTEEGWTNCRADKEIGAYKAKIKQASNAGKVSAERRFNGRSTDVPTDVQPTNNQEPITIKTLRPADVSELVWADFLALRKIKKSPITETGLSRIKSQATKAGLSLESALEMCCARGWQGFEAEWVKGDSKTPTASADEGWRVTDDGKQFFNGRRVF